MTSRRLAERKKRGALLLRGLKRLFPRPKIELRYSGNWELLVAVILSAQCTDKKVNEVTRELFKKYRSLNDYLGASRREFEKDIRSTGFYRNKAKNILAAANIIRQKHGGRVPRAMEKMLSLPGVARKTANVVLGNAYGVVEGVAVDTHVRRLSRLFDLTDEINPNAIERDLMEIFPREEWFNLTYRLIAYGRMYCPTRRHNHADHPLGQYCGEK